METKKQVAISVKATGYGSSVNGVELLFAALATCFVMIYSEKQQNEKCFIKYLID
jgi:organic hydroperoxide reductase OsmC/OhrA